QPVGLLRERRFGGRAVPVEDREQVDRVEVGAVGLGIGAAIFGDDEAAEPQREARSERRLAGAFGAVEANMAGHNAILPVAAARRHWISPSIDRPRSTT